MPRVKRTLQYADAADCFHQGLDHRAYEYFGAHRVGDRFSFRVWAPSADEVSLCGDFNGWDPLAHPMKRVDDRGAFEISVSADTIREGQNYKYRICNGDRVLYKADPYGISMQKPPETASVIFDLDGFSFRDGGWLKYRSTRFTREAVERQAINVYELHPGSWIRDKNWDSPSYVDLARELAPYLKQMGYTHVQLMPICEYPYDGSWGYQITGFYAPTSRFGNPTELMRFVDSMHEAGIGVILDWNPAYFATDENGLAEFDGSVLYERADEKGEFGVRSFDLERGEVRSFLMSNAAYWIERYHFDGLHVSELGDMLYPNGNRSQAASDFFAVLNETLAREYPDVMVIADETRGQTVGFSRGGLGFSLARSGEWSQRALAYVGHDPIYRKYEHGLLSETPIGQASVISVSHDDVTHGKKSLIDKMPGVYRQKFANLRVFLTYMMTFPGKKLLFMGGEIGQFREWDCDGQLEWVLGEYEMHAQIQQFCSELNHFYLDRSALWELDGEAGGFAWVDAENADMSVYSYRRADASGKELLILLNFTPVMRQGLMLEVAEKGVYEEVFNSDLQRFGGTGERNRSAIPTKTDGGHHTLCVTAPPLSAIVLERRE